MLGIFGFLGSLAKLFGGLMAWFQRRSDVRAGEVAQAAQETARAVTTEASVAEAEATAPRTQAAIVNALDAGTF